ncbi:hypothetical protein IWW50_001521 [Coemansia erecta]|nr:hypothetical protein GGF43_000253 [Coemansia sp. RSA 2618]KAJ2828177.1 hypothetical protein IWW50_001521 [Coemansia erecta]
MSVNGDYNTTTAPPSAGRPYRSDTLATSHTSSGAGSHAASLSTTSTQQQAAQVDLTEINGGLSMLLERSRQSLSSCKEAVIFLKSRSKVEEDYGRSLQKLTQQTLKLMDNGASTHEGMSTQQAAWQRLVEVHEPLAANRMKFSITLAEMSEYMGNYVKTKEGVRRRLRETEAQYQRAIDESLGQVEKARAKYEAQCVEWEKLLMRSGNNRAEGVLAAPMSGSSSGQSQPQHQQSKSGKHVSNAVSGIFGKHKGATQESLDRMGQEAGVKAKVANEAYKRLLHQHNTMRRDFYDVQLPKILASVMGLVEEVDQFLKFTLGKYAYTYESAVLADAITLKPMDGATGMVEMVGDIDSKADLDACLMHTARSTRTRVDRTNIPYREYRMSTRAQLYANPKPIFGIPLAQQLERDNHRVPLIVTKCAAAIEQFGLQNEGVYRQSGQSSQVMRLRNEFDLDAEHVELLRESSAFVGDVNNIASVLKMYLREVPELVPNKQRSSMLELFSTDDTDITANRTNGETDELMLAKKVSALAALFSDMPDANRMTLECLFTHLDKVQAFQEYNMMNSENLSIVFGPTILPPANNNPSNAALDIRRSARLVKFILDNRRSIFEAV